MYFPDYGHQAAILDAGHYIFDANVYIFCFFSPPEVAESIITKLYHMFEGDHDF